MSCCSRTTHFQHITPALKLLHKCLPGYQVIVASQHYRFFHCSSPANVWLLPIAIALKNSSKLDSRLCSVLGTYKWIAHELRVGTSLGRRHNLVRFQILDHFWIPQPKLHGAMYLIFFVKSQDGLVT